MFYLNTKSIFKLKIAKFYFVLFYCFFLFSCFSQRKDSFVISNKENIKRENYDNETFEKEFELSKNGDYYIEQEFSKIVDDSASESFDKNGFYSYIIHPQGAVYPFSRVKVKCIYGKNISHNIAKENCLKFLNRIQGKYVNFMKK